MSVLFEFVQVSVVIIRSALFDQPLRIQWRISIIICVSSALELS